MVLKVKNHLIHVRKIYSSLNFAVQDFQVILSLALIPPDHVRHAFTLITESAPLGMRGWLAYVSKTYIGTTKFEIDRGIYEFAREADVGHLFLRRTRSTTPFSGSQFSTATANSTNTTIQFGQLSPHPSTPTVPSTEGSSMRILRRWELNIMRPLRFSIPFWNVNARAQIALKRTNNGMEAAHGQFARELNHHPSLSDFIAAFLRDIERQLDIRRA